MMDICCVNAGENEGFGNVYKQDGADVKFENTRPVT